MFGECVNTGLEYGKLQFMKYGIESDKFYIMIIVVGLCLKQLKADIFKDKANYTLNNNYKLNKATLSNKTNKN